MPKTMHVASPVPPKSPAAEGHPTTEEIQLRAYEIFLERRAAPGDELADWLQAERELLQKYMKIAQPAKAKAKAA